MNELLYLLAAVALSAIGVTLLWWRSRKPQTLEGTIDEFSRGLKALAPEESRPLRSRQRPRGVRQSG